MSASREKKNRQDLASQGIQDPKAIREAEEKAQQRKANRLYGTIAVVFVLVAALLVVVNSGVLERSATAITVDGENYTAAQMNYYYYGIKNSIINSGYSSFYGIDTSVAMDKQNMSDTAKMLLQVTDEGDITWDQFFRDYATRQLSVQVMAAKEAEANGMGEDDDIRAEVNEVIDNITAGAKEQGYTLKSYLKLAYGSTMTVSTFKKMMTLEEVATHYMQHYQEELSYTESQLEEYYQANSSDFDVASYEYIYFKGTADSTTDADGNVISGPVGVVTTTNRIPVGLIVKQPDLGTSILVLIAGASVIFFAGLSKRILVSLTGILILSMPVIWSLMHDYQRQRVLTLLDPSADPLGKGFHILQALIAIGSGGFSGKGWMEGTQAHLDFIPERTSDFLFAVFSEEFGFVGNLVLLALYTALIGRSFYIAAFAETRFSRLLAGAIGCIFFTYTFVNMGMVSGILPVVGVPLPFMSYGGTALLILGVCTGILLSVSAESKH